MSRVLAIGDVHCPAMKEGYAEFCYDIAQQWECDRVVLIGDVLDWASISFHPKAPSLKNPEVEFEAAMVQISRLYELFPEADVMVGNHDCLSERQATEVGLPISLLKEYSDLTSTAGWTWHPRYSDLIIDGVIYRHGDKGLGGQFAALKNAQREMRSLVQGHLHAQSNIGFYACEEKRIFGVQTGCGVNRHHPAMQYGKTFAAKPLLSCAVILDGTTPVVEPWEMN